MTRIHSQNVKFFAENVQFFAPYVQCSESNSMQEFHNAPKVILGLRVIKFGPGGINFSLYSMVAYRTASFYKLKHDMNDRVLPCYSLYSRCYILPV